MTLDVGISEKYQHHSYITKKVLTITLWSLAA